MSGYAQFLKLRNDAKTLIPHEMELLMSEIEEWNKINSIKIRCAELLTMPHLGSPATTHKNLTSLIKNGFVAQDRDDVDKRIKYLSISKEGQKYLTQMENLFLQCTIKK